ncbi:MAG: OsmC family protein [Hydrogenophaga sp.]|nr:OsmC family protein [Hydrogenophaga sp.]
MSNTTITVSLTQQQDYRFLIEFGAPVPAVVGDEPPPLGAAAGPSPVQLLTASVGNCLSDSLLFALRKFKQAPEPIRTQVLAEVGRNAEGRLRVLSMAAELHLGVPAAQLEHLQRVLDTFEQYCTVTQTVAGAVDIKVRVFDSTGQQLK